MSSTVSLIIPVYNDARALETLLLSLQSWRSPRCELIVVDGGSTDHSLEIATPLADHALTASKGRAAQMNAGAAIAHGEILWFLHADSDVPPNALNLIETALRTTQWGRFDVTLSGRPRLLRLVEKLMNWRSRWTGIATGDQGIFVTRAAFASLGGYPTIPLMEDIALSSLLLKHFGKPACIATKLVTSSRRWEQNGIVKTIVLMWGLRFAYWCGVSPITLAALYYPERTINRRKSIP